MHPASWHVRIDPAVHPLRPILLAAIVRNLHVDAEDVRQLLSMQEDLHNGLGRRRRKVSIGLHNLDVLHPPIHYIAASRDHRFLPLGESKPHTLATLLTDTVTGRAYAPLVQGFAHYPLLLDAHDQVLSFPPILNSELTRVTEQTRNLFIDVTALDATAAADALGILVTTLHDMGGSVEAVQLRYPDRVADSPDLRPHRLRLPSPLAAQLLGLTLTTEELITSLRRCRLEAVPTNSEVQVSAPRYRTDLLHPVDLVEEVAIGYGVDRFEATLPPSTSAGRRHAQLAVLDRLRDGLTGLGLFEVMTYTLLSEAALTTLLQRPRPSLLTVANPKSLEHAWLRDSLLPALLLTLQRNVHEPYPQRLFEVGPVFRPSPGTPLPVEEAYNVAAVVAHAGAGYTEARSLVAACMAGVFGLPITTSPLTHPSFMPGRVAAVMADGMALGLVGEVHPAVLTAFGLRMPVAAWELQLTTLLAHRH